MAITFNALSCQQKSLDLILGEAGMLDVAKQIHYLGLAMQVVDDFWVRGRGQPKQHVGISGQHPCQFFNHLWPWRTLFATLDAAQIGGRDA